MGQDECAFRRTRPRSAEAAARPNGIHPDLAERVVWYSPLWLAWRPLRKENIENCLTEERRPVAARPTVGDVIPVNAVTGDHRRRLADHIDGRLSASRQQSSQPKPTVAALTTCSPNGTSPPRRRSRSRRFWRHSILQHDRARDKRLARVSHGLGLLHQGHMVSLNCSQQRWTVRVDSSHSPSRPLRPLTCVG